MALANALEALGHKRSVGELTKLCKTNATDGTSPKNLIRAIQALKESCGLDEHEVLRTSDPAAAWAICFSACHGGRAAVMVVDSAEHYVSAVAINGKRLAVVDSADTDVVKFYDKETLLERWDSGGRFPYWAVIL